MYRSLNMYLNTNSDISMHTWWHSAKKYPNRTNRVSSVISVLCGMQPRGMQHNPGRNICKLCSQRQNETNEHILLYCSALNDTRKTHIHHIKSTMPNALLNDFSKMNSEQQLYFLISCLGESFVPEYDTIYDTILNYVYCLYMARDELYIDALGRENVISLLMIQGYIAYRPSGRQRWMIQL